MMYSAEQLEQLRTEYSKYNQKYTQFFIQFSDFSVQKLKNENAREYILHGFLRRVQTLKRCVENIYTICPPEQSDKQEKEELLDITINLQSFIFNVFGSIDNLAWAWAKEKDFKYNRKTEITFSNKKLREQLSSDFRSYLSTLEDWFNYLEDYRHALAHRIPLYIPPFNLTESEDKLFKDIENQKRTALHRFDFVKINQLNLEQKKIGTFIPVMRHSITESSRPVGFHAQVLTDWITIVDIASNFMNEFN